MVSSPVRHAVSRAGSLVAGLQRQARFTGAGIRPGDRTLVMVRPGLPLIAAVFGLFGLGAVPVVTVPTEPTTTVPPAPPPTVAPDPPAPVPYPSTGERSPTTLR